LLVVASAGVNRHAVRMTALYKQNKVFTVPKFSTVTECTPSGVNVTERGTTLPGSSYVSLIVTMPSKLQL